MHAWFWRATAKVLVMSAWLLECMDSNLLKIVLLEKGWSQLRIQYKEAAISYRTTPLYS